MNQPTFDENGHLATVVVDAKKFTELTNELVALRNRVTDLESELAGYRLCDLALLELYKRHKHLDMFLSDEKFPPIGRTGSAILYELWEFVKQAIGDGEVSESEAEKSLRTAIGEMQSGSVRPLSELWDGIDDEETA